MTPDLRRSGVISAGLHGALLLALLLTLKPPPAPPLGDSAITMAFSIDSAQVQRAQNPAPTPAPAPADVSTPDLPSPVKPLPTPVEAPPPPPPPPPPPAPMAAPPPAPPLPAPPLPAPPLPTPPVPPLAMQAPVALAPAPLQAVPAPRPPPPIPPPPKPAPQPPQPAMVQPAPPRPAPTPPRPVVERPNPAPRPTQSTSTQPNPSRTTVDNSRTLEATLDRFRSRQPQTQAPARPYNPPRGGAVGGGAVEGVDNAKLSASARGAIGDRIRECWTRDAGARDADQLSAILRIVTDAAGTVRDASIVRPGAGPAGIAFAERARRAALDAKCNPIPLPTQLLGQNHTFEITFKP